MDAAGNLFQREHDPVSACGISFGTAITGADGKGVQVAAADGVICLAGQGFRMQAGVGEHGCMLGQFAHRLGSESVGLSHGTSRVVGILRLAALQLCLAELLALLLNRSATWSFTSAGE